MTLKAITSGIQHSPSTRLKMRALAFWRTHVWPNPLRSFRYKTQHSLSQEYYTRQENEPAQDNRASVIIMRLYIERLIATRTTLISM